ncbi:hypothetical protein [Cryobacterium tagatosivorans]|uniref:Uridine kinase n=1 Tax=Cryobacterium tagatosivorans TaxID=1259199 RepID=A0A4V3I684_9MICO|nr:hypothetical protein [Cryobacterium tagatosivorans]TFB48394.1 hypothetical protein E3O23_13565 [Cryobacterium tagatosivorans]
MRLVSTPRIEFLRGLSTEILGHYGRGRTIVAIDGTDAPARAAFADDLAAVLEEGDHAAVRASLGDFRRSRAELNRRGADAPERHYRNGYDYSALRRALVEPFRLGGSTGFVTKEFDADSDTWVQPTWLTAPADATLVIDGEFIHRPELRGLWSYSVLLEGEATTEAERLYRAEAKPRDRATAIVDLADADRPRRIFADSC